jgi:predicted dehydrogenase
VRVVVVGCGDIAMTGHLPAITRSRDVELVGLVDPNRDTLVELCGVWGVPGAADLGEAEGWGVEAVIVATPPEVTPSVTMEAMKRGLHVLCEKPMAVDASSAESVHAMATAGDRIVQVGFVNRFSPVIARVREWIGEGRLGRPPLLFLLSTFDERYDPQDEVHTSRILHFLATGPAFIHEAAHQTDYVAYLGGGVPVDVVSRGLTSEPSFPSENYTCGLVRFDNGNLARLEVTWMYPSMPRGDFRILGPQASVYVSRAEGRAELQGREGIVDRFELRGRWMDASFDGQLAAFVQAVRTGQPVGPTTHDGLASLRLCQRIVAGMHGGSQ